MINKIQLQTEMKIKGTKRNIKQETIIYKFIGWSILKYFLFFFTFINFINIALHIYLKQYDSSFYFKIGSFLLGTIVYFLLSYNEKVVFDKIFKPIPLQSDELEYFVQQINPNVKLFYFESSDIKLATAYVLDGKQKIICISNYLLNNTTINEQKATIAHKLGHIKLRHKAKHNYFNLLGYLLGIIIHYMTLLLFTENYLLTLSFNLIFLFLYYVIFKNLLIKKYQRMADLFMIEVGVEKEEAIKLLEKVSSLNYLPRKGKKRNQLFTTYPSIESRIKYLKSI